jgi:hypothetical protein
MRWPWSRKRGQPESAPVTPEPKQVWDLEKMKHQFEARGFSVELMPLGVFGLPSYVPRVPTDPYDINPAFDMRYEQVKFGETISVKAIKYNANTFKLRVREVYTDPKRVARRHWHRYMVKKRLDRIIDDSNLFYGTRKSYVTEPALVSRLARKGNLRLVK